MTNLNEFEYDFPLKLNKKQKKKKSQEEPQHTLRLPLVMIYHLISWPS